MELMSTASPPLESTLSPSSTRRTLLHHSQAPTDEEKATTSWLHITDSITKAIPYPVMCSSHHKEELKRRQEQHSTKVYSNPMQINSPRHNSVNLIQCSSHSSSNDDDDDNDGVTSKHFNTLSSSSASPSVIMLLLLIRRMITTSVKSFKWKQKQYIGSVSHRSTASSASFIFNHPFSTALLLLLLLIITSTTQAQQEQPEERIKRMTANSGNSSSSTPTRHQCYVCLPPDKSSHEAREILGMFGSSNIPDCAAFGPHNAHQFEFTCPDKYVGCLRRALTTNPSLVSRTCVNLAIDDCKVANSVEYCYCSGDLCNGEKPARSLLTSAERRDEDLENRGYWKEGITDDEDLLGPNSNHPEGSGDDHDSEHQIHNGHHHQNNGNDNSRNPLKPSDDNDSSQENSSSTTQFKRKHYSGSNIPASSNKGSIRHTETTEGGEENLGNPVVKSNANNNNSRAYYYSTSVIIIILTVIATTVSSCL